MAQEYISVEGILSAKDSTVTERLTGKVVKCFFDLSVAKRALELDGERVAVNGLAAKWRGEVEHVLVDYLYEFTPEEDIPTLEQLREAIRKANTILEPHLAEFTPPRLARITQLQGRGKP